MIEGLSGTHETVIYKKCPGVKIYRNNFISCYPTHWHTCIEIIMPIENIYTAKINKRSEVIDVNDIIIIAPGELHSITAPQDYGERLILQFDYTLVFNTNEIRSLITMLKPYFIVRANENVELSLALRDLLYKIEREYSSTKPFSEMKTYSYVLSFLSTLGCSNIILNHNNSETSYGNTELFLSVCDYINDNYASPITLNDVVDHSGFSKSHFCRFFKSNAGKSFYDYLMELRISHADSLLQCSDKSVLDISIETGFNSLTTFNRVFKQMHSCTPNEYRKMLYR